MYQIFAHQKNFSIGDIGELVLQVVELLLEQKVCMYSLNHHMHYTLFINPMIVM